LYRNINQFLQPQLAMYEIMTYCIAFNDNV
jgi:hypothetical protein